MARRIVFALAAAAAALAAAPADDAADKVWELPPPPAVPAEVDLPPKDFAQPVAAEDPFRIEMVYVPGGEFALGSPPDEAGRSADEGPQRRAKVRPFWLAKYEVTWDQFDAFWKDESLYAYGKLDEIPPSLKGKITPDALTRPSLTYVDELYDHGRDGHPALCMSHHAAMMYCHWLRHKTKLPYRLPTEAEWEYACRAGHDGPFGFAGGAGGLAEYAWYKANSAEKADAHVDAADARLDDDGRTHKVGTRKPNAFGLYDMHGNVAEWVLDRHAPDFYSTLPADRVTEGPVNRPTDGKWGHVARGGSWADPADRCRCAARRFSDRSWIAHDPQDPQSIWWLTKMDVIGFRVALPTAEYPALVGLKPTVAKKSEPAAPPAE